MTLMKTFLFSLFLSLSLFSVSQIYIVSVSQVKMHIKYGYVSYLDAVNFPDKIIDDVETDTKHVLNLVDSTCSFYYHGVYVNTVPIIKFQNDDGVLQFTMEDYDINGLTVRSNFVIDTVNNNIFYYWFNEIKKVTKVEIKTKFKIQLH